MITATQPHAGHGHPSLLSSRSGLERRLLISLSIAVFFTVFELVGGVLSNSLALIGDAGHVGTDALSLALAAFAMKLAERPHTSTSTYGYHRAEVLAAFTNAATLFLVSGYIFYEAYSRFLSPPEVKGPLLLAVAAIGLGANLVMMFILRRGADVSINIQGAFLHVLGDTFSSVGVIVGGVAIVAAGLFIIDPIVAVLIGVIILRSGLSLIKDAARVLLEQVPKGFDVAKVVDEIMKIDGVKGVHDFHVWSLTSGLNVLSGHVETKEHGKDHEVLEAATRLLREKFNIAHTTIQIEHRGKATGLVNIESKSDR